MARKMEKEMDLHTLNNTRHGDADSVQSDEDTLLPHDLTERLDVLGSVAQQQLLHLGVKVLPRLHQGTAVLAPADTRELSTL